MNDFMVHRGPDAAGYWEAPPDARGWTAMLAHRRLSILDLSPAGAQPMVDPATGHVVVLNGEIYNFAELRGRLAARGERFQSSGDTAVMLRMLSFGGPEAVGQLRGMFAFAFWNVAERSLLLGRDPLGIKPLYMARNPDPAGGWSLVFASEVRGILASGLLDRPRLNPVAAASIAWNGFMVTPETAVAGIEPVWPGQMRIFDQSGLCRSEEFYWDIASQSGAQPVDEDQLSRALEESVRLHLTSDAPLSVFLSGGVDSSAVANLAQKASSTPIHTFTLAFEEEEFNEGGIARQVAAEIGTHHQELVLTEERFISKLDAALESLDQPTFNGINSYYMSQAVRDAGFKVALVGTGGDELFGGYTSFRDLPSLATWSRRSKCLPLEWKVGLARRVSSALVGRAGRVPQQTRWAKLPEMVRRGGSLLSLYQVAYALFLPEFRDELLNASGGDNLQDGLPAAMRARLLAETTGRSDLSAISVMEQRLFLGERLLRDTDATSMAASIEIRLPLVDQILFEHVDRFPDAGRFMPLRRKAVLRRMGLKGLNPSLFDRPKSGFVLPYDRWLRGSLGKLLDQTMRDPAAIRPTGLNPDAVGRLWQAFLDGAPGIYWSRIWALYVLIHWTQRHRVYLESAT